jgi:hypothetical protein
MCAARLANLEAHRPKKSTAIAGVSQADAAKLFNVSEDSIGRAKAVLSTGSKERIERKAADERQRAGKSSDGIAGGRGRKKPGGNLPPSNEGKSRDNTARAVGMALQEAPGSPRRRAGGWGRVLGHGVRSSAFPAFRSLAIARAHGRQA